MTVIVLLEIMPVSFSNRMARVVPENLDHLILLAGHPVSFNVLLVTTFESTGIPKELKCFLLIVLNITYHRKKFS